MHMWIIGKIIIEITFWSREDSVGATTYPVLNVPREPRTLSTPHQPMYMV